MKIKKLMAIFLLTILFIAQFNLLLISYAEDQNLPSFLTTIQKVEEKTVHPGEEFSVHVKISDFQNIEQGLISLGGQLEYDTNILERIEITEEGSQWNQSVINEDNFKFVTDAESYVTQAGNIFTIRFKAKENISNSVTTTIKVKDIIASNGLIDIESEDTQLEIQIEIPNLPDSITSNKYVIEENMISRIAPKTTVNSFKQNVQAVGQLVFTDKNGNVLNDNDVIGTNTKLRVGNTLQFSLVVIGDIDENGELNITDLAQLKLHYIEETLLSGIHLKAADVDGNGKITITDLAQIKLVLIGKKEIK